MGFLNLFGGDSSSSSATTNTDARLTTENGNINQVKTTGAVNFSTTDGALATHAIDAVTQNSKDTLAAATALISEQYHGILENITRQTETASNTLTSAQAAAAQGITQAQQSASQQVTRFLYVLLGVGVVAFAIHEGYFK